MVNSDGSPRAAKSSIDGITHTWVISLNPKYSSTASKEFWGSIVIHELVHSFITIYFKGRTAPTMDEEHEIIFRKWIDQMSDFLVQSYNMAKTDANSLALGGLDDILKGFVNGDPIFKQGFDDMAQKKYGTTLASAENTRYDYKTGIKGTKCE